MSCLTEPPASRGLARPLPPRFPLHDHPEPGTRHNRSPGEACPWEGALRHHGDGSQHSPGPSSRAQTEREHRVPRQARGPPSSLTRQGLRPARYTALRSSAATTAASQRRPATPPRSGQPASRHFRPRKCSLPPLPLRMLRADTPHPPAVESPWYFPGLLLPGAFAQ